MPMTSREMVNYLKKHGFIITSQSGSHINYFILSRIEPSLFLIITKT